ncbi:hypothetical protein V6N13_026876 [Hibiscus sabdariffa]
MIKSILRSKISPLVGPSFLHQSHLDSPAFRFRGSSEVSASRLDRFLLSAEVVSSVSNLSLKALPRGLSDHNPIFLNEEQSFPGKRPFNWFLHWADDWDFVAMVETVMQQQSNRNLPSALRKVKEAVKCWVVDKQSKDVDNIVHLEKRISDLESSLIVGVVMKLCHQN